MQFSVGALYFTAVASVTLITVIKLAFSSTVGFVSPFLLYYSAIMFAAVIGGRGPGILATFLSAISVYYNFLMPNAQLGFSTKLIELTLFMIEGVSFTLFCEALFTARRNAELRAGELRLSEERFRLSVDGVKDYAIITLDGEGVITSWNRGAEQVLGYSPEQALKKHISLFYLLDDVQKKKPWNDLKTASKEGEVQHEGYLLRSDQSEFWADVVITRLQDEQGVLRGFSQIIRDITGRRQLEQRKDAFISIASHELKTPLTSIKAYVQILQKTMKKTVEKEVPKYLGKMDDQVNKLTTFLNR